jgi:hypothetical protein
MSPTNTQQKQAGGMHAHHILQPNVELLGFQPRVTSHACLKQMASAQLKEHCVAPLVSIIQPPTIEAGYQVEASASCRKY